VRASIAFNRPISPSYRHLGLAAASFPRTVAPGQFVMVRPPLVADPLLPRAFSIYRVSRGATGSPVVEILYKILGKGTQYLAQMDPGQALELLGPLGNSFTVPKTGLAVLVAGGIGVPPIAALAAQMGNPPAGPRSLEVFLGGKTSDDILCLKDFEAAGACIRVTTEDGSLGTRGLITDLLDPFLSSSRKPRAASRGTSAECRVPGAKKCEPEAASRGLSPSIFTCGPLGMLSAVGRLAEQYDIPCQVSMEANMACGFGACMGCAIEARTTGAAPAYKLVCQEGPVFDSRELMWR
jgi:dihydroorotate dehydrogenase electron transfer subunit